MASSKRIQGISKVFRYLVIAVGLTITAAVGLAIITEGQSWVTLGDDQLAAQVEAGEVSTTAASLLVAPVAVLFLLGVYWLQRLFGAYQMGRFFTDDVMVCYLWLVWLKVISFFYNLLLPVFASLAASGGDEVDAALTLDLGTLTELMVLLLIVHILKRAQGIKEENESFV
ncbi:DUF2975 domain-containing protein [Halioglobus maricola]|uniref:DUF2975 domain-containing protein n=1 Tax=Halioglobus maricola TaxID=2601894 RepID=A0A5P9NMZ6_9GAMM|nr:DUF2975 domain-containing protein [Halioglobus maricola]QFU76855.1 DUF2975 domain-containing protein [Halioglobus maricola]